MKRYSAKDKYEIVAEGRRSPKGIKQVCSKYQISRETFYQWEAKIKQAALTALEDTPPGPKAPVRDQSTAELEATLEKLKIENACLKIKQEWNEFQIELHGSPEQKALLSKLKKKDTAPGKKSGSLTKK